jgi:hypothetical protein
VLNAALLDGQLETATWSGCSSTAATGPASTRPGSGSGRPTCQVAGRRRCRAPCPRRSPIEVTPLASASARSCSERPRVPIRAARIAAAARRLGPQRRRRPNDQASWDGGGLGCDCDGASWLAYIYRVRHLLLWTVGGEDAGCVCGQSGAAGYRTYHWHWQARIHRSSLQRT